MQLKNERLNLPLLLMPNILFVTVGGSPQPIITAIKSLNPDQVVFICSPGPKGSESQVTGSGTPCKIMKEGQVIAEQPNIPTQLNLGDKFQAERDLIVLENLDDLGSSYQAILRKMKQWQHENPQGKILADYTGGTKTMSLALGMAAVDMQAQVYVTTSNRENLNRVEWGENTERATISAVIIQQKLLKQLPSLFEQYNYPAIITELNSLLNQYELPTSTRQQLRTILNFAQALEAWDRFDHNGAWPGIKAVMKHHPDLGKFLKRVISSRGSIDPNFDASNGTFGHGYEIVEDLLLNADRRASQNRFDDAVGRLYRALELLGQLYLKNTHKIQTGDVDLALIPESLKAKYEKKKSKTTGKIQIALRESYKLLTELNPDDPLGQLYHSQEQPLMDVLQIRNYSLFAHGFRPIDQASYQQVKTVIAGFIQAGIRAIIPAKPKLSPAPFPQAIILDL